MGDGQATLARVTGAGEARLGSCRFCAAPLRRLVADLGMSPLANSYLREHQLQEMEPFFPLVALVCERCMLVQLGDFESAQAIFSEYAYFSSYSTTWLDHAARYVEAVTDRLGLDKKSNVVEVASNDGYLLQFFSERGIPVLGIEPARNVAQVAIDKGLPTVVEFFGATTARRLAGTTPADLLIANNVLAHVPDLNDFVAGMKLLLAPEGWITIEFPHLLRMVEEVHFETIYHEHFSYFSLSTAARVLARHGLRVVDVDELATHLGSLRIYAVHAERPEAVSPRVVEILDRERAAGLDDVATYEAFGDRVRAEKLAILDVLVAKKRQGLTIAGYGAPAKGNTLLNYCGIGTDFLDFTVDASPHKQGLYLPGTHIPVLAPEAIGQRRPDLVFILPWNLRDEIMAQLAYVREWGARFILRTPQLSVV